jgi:RHS repeat-associated protein
MLGSSRTMVQAGQTTPCYDADFYPFGGERAVTNTCPQNYKFEGKERDSETGNDDFGARYYASNYGRWLSADWSAVPAPVPYANLTNPQTLNLYAMVADNPESFADLDGHEGNKSDSTFTTTNSPCISASDPRSNATGGGAPGAVCGGRNPEGPISQQKDQEKNEAQNASTAPLAVPVVVETVKDLVIAYPEATPLIVLGGLMVTSAIEGGGAGLELDFSQLAIFQQGNDSNATSKDGSPGPKADQAPGVTAGGQATDKYGNKLGPSGEPQVNKTRSNTREGARNKALSEGSGAVEHRNPKRGNPHFHPTDNEGNKKPSSTHHEYPE